MAAYELNVRDYIRIIKKRIFVIISSGIIFAVAAFFYVNYRIPCISSQYYRKSNR